MTTEHLLVKIPAEHAGAIKELAAAFGGRVEPWNIILGKYGYLHLDTPYNSASLIQAAARALGIPELQWDQLTPLQQRQLAELGADDWAFMNEGQFESEAQESLRQILIP